MTADEEYSDEEWLTIQAGLIERLEAALRDARAERDALRRSCENWQTAVVDLIDERDALRREVGLLEAERDALRARVAELERHLAASGAALVKANAREAR